MVAHELIDRLCGQMTTVPDTISVTVSVCLTLCLSVCFKTTC